MLGYVRVGAELLSDCTRAGYSPAAIIDSQNTCDFSTLETYYLNYAKVAVVF